MAICRYLDEEFREPNLFGRGVEERANIHMWARRAEASLFVPSVEFGHHSHPLFREQINQIPAYAELCRATIEKSYSLFDSHLADATFIGGTTFSVADIVAFCGLELAHLWQVALDRSLTRWHQAILERPSSSIARYV